MTLLHLQIFGRGGFRTRWISHSRRLPCWLDPLSWPPAGCQSLPFDFGTSWVTRAVTAYSTKPRMPVVVSLEVIWCMVRVYSRLVSRSSSAKWPLDTMWSARAPKGVLSLGQVSDCFHFCRVTGLTAVSMKIRVYQTFRVDYTSRHHRSDRVGWARTFHFLGEERDSLTFKISNGGSRIRFTLGRFAFQVERLISDEKTEHCLLIREDLLPQHMHSVIKISLTQRANITAEIKLLLYWYCNKTNATLLDISIVAYNIQSYKP